MKNFKDVYNAKELFYWCNFLGEVNLDEYPPEICDACKKYWRKGIRYVVTFEGKIGVLLYALYSEDDVAESTEDKMGTYNFASLMSKSFDYLCGKAAMLESLTKSFGCSSLVGEYSDQQGHEMALFIPIEANDEKVIEKLTNLFKSCVYTEEDSAFFKEAAEHSKMKLKNN